MKSYYSTVTKLLGNKTGTILEIGSGEGEFLTYLARHTNWDVFGCDIHEHAGNSQDRYSRVEKRLKEATIPLEKYKWMHSGDPLPFESASIDIVVSIQTLEHVEDLSHLFSEIQRVLKPEGSALHYFPTIEILIDPHSGVPFAHRMDSRARRRGLAFFSRLGIGKYRRYRRERKYDLNRFVGEFDRYIEQLCHFRSIDECLRISENSGLKAKLIPPPPLPPVSWVARIVARFTSIYIRQEKEEFARYRGMK